MFSMRGQSIVKGRIRDLNNRRIVLRNGAKMIDASSFDVVDASFFKLLGLKRGGEIL